MQEQLSVRANELFILLVIYIITYNQLALTIIQGPVPQHICSIFLISK